MASTARSGQGGFEFSHRPDLRVLPKSSGKCEVDLHGGFAVDKRPGQGEVYYGMPGCGVIRVSADLTTHEILDIPPALRLTNFHGTKLGDFDGSPRLFLAANGEGAVHVLTLDGDLEVTLSRPELREYADDGVVYVPTDTVPRPGNRLIVADGYGSNFISTVDVAQQRWLSAFGGKTQDATEHGKFGTAHGINPLPGKDRLIIADRPHSRLEVQTFEGKFEASYSLPSGSRPCGIDFIEWQGRQLAVVGSLDDPDPNRPAPIYVLDGDTFEVLSTIRPKVELGLELVDHLHNVVWHIVDGELHIVCQAWKPGFYFVLRLAA